MTKLTQYWSSGALLHLENLDMDLETISPEDVRGMVFGCVSCEEDSKISSPTRRIFRLRAESGQKSMVEAVPIKIAR